MSPKEKRRLEGIVVRRTAYGDADWIVSLFTREEGLVRAIAKHARSSRRRFGGALDLFVSLKAELSPAGARGGLWRLDAVELRDAYLGIRKSLPSLALASQCCEAVAALVHEHEALPALYEGLESILAAAAEGPSRPALLRVWFFLLLLKNVGLAPHLDACTRCGRSPGEFEAAVFVPSEGGVVCEHCTAAQGPRRLPGAGVQVYSQIAGLPLRDLEQVRITSEGLALLDRLTLEFVEDRAGKALESARNFPVGS